MKKTAKITALCNQKGGVGKTATTVNLGIGLAREGKRVLLADIDPQGSLTASLGYQNPDQMENTLAEILGRIISEEPLPPARALSTMQKVLISFRPTLNCPAERSRW